METPDLLVTTFTYDLANRLAEAEDPLGNVSTNVYDVMGRLIATVDGEGARTSYSYDLAGRPVEAQDPLEQRSTIQYNSLDQVEVQVDALGYRTSYVQRQQ
jgi:YD repeat-containing protein